MAGKKILVADDSLTIQKVIKLALSNEGYEIKTVSDGNEAVQEISLFRPDVVLVDVSLPGKNAFEVKRSVNQGGLFEEIKFILMSSAFEKVDEVAEKESHFHGRLTKPFDPAHLRQLLSQAMGIHGAPQKQSPPPARPTSMSPPGSTSRSTAPRTSAPSTATSAPRASAPSASRPAAPPPPVMHSTPYTASDPFEPIHPIEEPSLAPLPITGGSDGLWDERTPPPPPPGGDDLIQLDEPSFSDVMRAPGPDLAPPEPQPEFPPQAPQAHELSDIKQLTESTIRMSGLDDFGWNVNESAQKNHPLVNLDPEPEQDPEPSLPPPSGLGAHANDPSFFGSGSIDYPSAHGTPFNDLPPPPAPREYRGAHEAQVMPLTAAQMEDIIRSQLQDTLVMLAQKILPEVAERVIKQEIRKMLEEQA